MARKRRRVSVFRARGVDSSSGKPRRKMDKATKRYFRALFTIMFILFGGMILGQMVVEEIVNNASEQLYTNITSISMLIVSFFVAVIAWQGLGVLSVIMWVLLKLITFRLGKAEPPTQKLMPPHAWKMIPYAALTCAIYGAVIGFANVEVPLFVTIIDFGIAGAGWGVLLNILAKFRFLPYVDFQETLNEMAIEEALEDDFV